jgi:GNAT superfamily N-acetyltransferase
VKLTVTTEDLSCPHASALLRELDEYLNDLYEPEDNFFELAPEEVDGHRGIFVVARDDGTPVGCAAARRISPSTAELKRMFVVPAARGKGTGRAILGQLEAWARSEGLSRLVLECGLLQREAVTLYTSVGFVQIPCFGEYADAPLSVCYAKQLQP